jgi:hypothetical protein
MDRERFDRIARVLAASPTRRAVSHAIAGLALGGAALTAQNELTKGKKKPCKPCRKRVNGRCTGKKPDGRACEGTGKCFDGKCIPTPDCQATGTDCTQGNPGVCCSQTCREDNHCRNSVLGQQCLAQSDCAFGACIAYVCREP